MDFIQTDDGKKGSFTAVLENKPGGIVSYVYSGPGKIILDHTEVFAGFEGRGIAKQLVLKVVDMAREQQLKILPLCPYAKGLFEKMPELQAIRF